MVKDNRFRPWIKVQKGATLVSSQLSSNKRFWQASKNWDRGRTTMHKVLMKFCNVTIDVRGPKVIQMPSGQKGVYCANEM